MRQGREITKGSPGWMITYADMMALLLCLFILLLSFSKIDSTSFKKNAGPINQAFGIARTTPELPAPAPAPVVTTPVPTPKLVPLEPRRTERDRILDLIDSVLADEMSKKRIDVEVRDDYVIIRFPGSDAFPSGEAELVPGFLPTLDRIRVVAARSRGRVVISGHTDDLPISTQRFRSNWDLSAARAASVAHYLLSEPGLDKGRILVQGAADSRPLVPNDSPEHRARNRRVEIALEIAVPRREGAGPGTGPGGDSGFASGDRSQGGTGQGGMGETRAPIAPPGGALPPIRVGPPPITRPTQQRPWTPDSATIPRR